MVLLLLNSLESPCALKLLFSQLCSHGLSGHPCSPVVFTDKSDNTAAFVSVPKFSLSPALQAVLWKTVPKFLPTVPVISRSLCPLWYGLYRLKSPRFPMQSSGSNTVLLFSWTVPVFSQWVPHFKLSYIWKFPHYSCWQSLSFYWSMSCLCILDVLLTQHLARELTNEPWAIIQLCFIRQTLGGAVPPPEQNSDHSTGLGCATKTTPIIRQLLCRGKKKIALILL